MPRQLDLICAPPQPIGNWMRYSASMPDGKRGSHTLRLDIPCEWSEAVTPNNADPFVLGFLFQMMQLGLPVHVHGTVSPSLLADLERFMHYWAAWRPGECKFVHITADAEQEVERRKSTGSEAIMCFSGGVDACYTAWRHTQGLVAHRRQNLKAGILVSGFLDLPPNDTALFETALEANRKILSSVGMETIPLRTNACELPWWSNLTHGPFIAGCLNLFAGRFDTGLIANSITYNEIDIVHGSTPASDPLMASRSMKILDDGGEAERYEKIEEILPWPQALRYLRVCNRPTADKINCGTCEKCIRTILAFRMVGGMLPPCFDEDASDSRIRQVRLHHDIQLRLLYEILKEAHSRGMDSESWTRAVASVIRRGRWRLLKRTIRGNLPWNRNGRAAHAVRDPVTVG